jgi:hypothetical protein
LFLSTDYKPVKATWQSEISREEVFRRFPDKRSWWIDSSGEIFDAGSDHEGFVKEHPELFDHNEIFSTYHAIRKFWVRVSAWGPSFTIQSRNINQKQLDAAQILYMREGEGKRVEFFQENVIPTSFDKEEFLELKNVHQLKRMRSRVGSSPTRAWFVSPRGEVIDCGQSHDACMRDRPVVFGNVRDLMDLIPMGWIRVGNLGYYTFIDCDRMTAKQLDKIQELVARISHENIEINKKDRRTKMTRSEFLSLNSPGEINRRRAGSPSDYMKGQHPDKKSWWVNPEGKIFDSGHDHNKFLEERPKTFGKWADINKALTMNWVRVAFWGGEYVVHCHTITRAQLAACQEIYKSLGGEHRIFISTLNKNGYISPHDFIWADSQSDLMKSMFRDPTGIRASVISSSYGRKFNKQSWWLSPEGKVIDAGFDHDKFVEGNPQLFNGADVDTLMEEDWVKAGDFVTTFSPSEFYITGVDLNRKQLEAAQSIYQSLGGRQRVRIQLPEISGDIPGSTFFAVNSVSDLRRELFKESRVKRFASILGGAWFVTPDRKVFDCRYDHDTFMSENQGMLRSMGLEVEYPEDLLKEGWGKIGILGSLIYLECERLNGFFFKVLQELTEKYHEVTTVLINRRRMSRQDFLFMDGPGDVRRVPEVEGRRRSASLPKSRNFLMGVSLDSLSWPLRQAFDLLGLSGKKDKLSANQVVSVFQANDKFLQDHLGRTSTELIQDLNAMFQYGPAKGQIA